MILTPRGPNFLKDLHTHDHCDEPAGQQIGHCEGAPMPHPHRMKTPFAACLRAAACLAALLVAPGLVSAQNGDGDIEFQPEGADQGPPSQTLARAAELYEKKDYYSASIELKKVLGGETKDTEGNRQRAEFLMGWPRAVTTAGLARHRRYPT